MELPTRSLKLYYLTFKCSESNKQSYGPASEETKGEGQGNIQESRNFQRNGKRDQQESDSKK